MTRFLGQDLWLELERLAQVNEPRTVVAPYYTDDSRIRCGSGDTIIVDATETTIAAGQTSAALLLKAAKRGAAVFCHRSLHAKIVLGTSFAVVSSANVSAASPRLNEAGVLLIEPELVSNVSIYVAGLAAEAKRLSSAELKRLASIVVKRSPGFTGSKPSLFHALEENLPALEDVAFGCYAGDASSDLQEVTAAAELHAIPLPKGWTYYESAGEPGVAELIKRACEHRPYIDFPVKFASDRTVVEFKDHHKKARPFIGLLRLNNQVISYFGSPGYRVPLDLSADPKPLTAVLNRGLQRAPSSLVNAISGASGIISPNNLRDLFDLGSRSRS